MRYFVTFEDAMYPLLPPVCYLLRILAACRVNLRASGYRGEWGAPPSRAMNFEWPGPQRLLIEPQILAISKGIWKALSTGGEMKCTRDKHTIVAFPSRCVLVFRWIEMGTNLSLGVSLGAFTSYVIFWL